MCLPPFWTGGAFFGGSGLGWQACPVGLCLVPCFVYVAVRVLLLVPTTLVVQVGQAYVVDATVGAVEHGSHCLRVFRAVAVREMYLRAGPRFLVQQFGFQDSLVGQPAILCRMAPAPCPPVVIAATLWQ